MKMNTVCDKEIIMSKFFTKDNDGNYVINGTEYSLRVSGHRVGVLLDGTQYAELDVRTAVPKTLDDDSGFVADIEEDIPVLVSVTEEKNCVTFVWTNKSSLWEKEYKLICNSLRFRYMVTVKGEGRVDGVEYFRGNAGIARYGSSYEFSEGFNPCRSWFPEEDYHFTASRNCHRWSVLMVPPMFCYGFKMSAQAKLLGLGLVAKPGEHNFHSFDYKVASDPFYYNGFCLVTDQYGHVTVNGEWTAPEIIGYSADHEDDVVVKYSNYYYSSGNAKIRKAEDRPRFWYGPIVCGWIEQIVRSVGDMPCDDPSQIACQPLYEDIIRKIKKYELSAKALIVDDKWQKHYATDEVDPDKWSDMRGFIDERHKEGIHTMLWFKLWDTDGWEGKPCLETEKGERTVDPSHPEFLKNLDEVMHRLLSADEGCYDCDGFKLDFAFWNPIGRKVHSYSGKYGVELLYDYMAYIYKAAKAVKPTALINCSPCHPYFAHICDQARLHDYDGACRCNREDMTMRGKMFAYALPGVLLDTDNAAFNTRRDAMRWLINQNTVGVPALYSLTPTESCKLTDEDFVAISQMWKEYSEIMDERYGKDQ